MFAVASVGSQWLLRRAYRPLIARDPRHRWLLRDLARALRLRRHPDGLDPAPVHRGGPDQPVRFFRGDVWENAYVIVARMIWEVLSGGG